MSGYYGGSGGGDSWRIIDADGDTYVNTESSDGADEDIVRIEAPNGTKVNTDATLTFGGNTLKIGLLAGREDTDVSVNMGSVAFSDIAARASTFFGARGRGTESTPLATQADDSVFDFAAVAYDGSGMSLVGILSSQVDGAVATNSTPGRWVVKVSDGSGVNAQVEVARFNSDLHSIFSGRIQGLKGADAASGSTLTLGNGNYFDVTGTTTIDYITTTKWQAGSMITLQFDASVTVNHNTGSVPANTAAILLAGSGNFAATANDTLTLIYDGATWRETARAVI